MVVHAKPSYYANRGTLSLAAREIRMVGLGELLARLERRRQLLAAEGLFAAELKRPLPFLPRLRRAGHRPGSAAERDVLENARRRWPAVAFEVVYAAMQGPRSAAEVIEALERLDREPDVDVIVVARGGGSVEDLLPFSDEALVRAVHGLRTPVVSAIGHEPDTPLLDLVADVRASTPTDAAKLVVPDVAEEVRGRDLGPRPDPRRCWAAAGPRADRARRAALPPGAGRPRQPGRGPARRGGPAARARPAHRRRTPLDRAGDDIGHQRARARALSPLATLQRGYAVLQDADGHVVTSVAGVGRRRAAPGPRRRRPGPRDHRPGRTPRRQQEEPDGRRADATSRPARSWSRSSAGSRPAASPSRSRWRCGSAASSSPRSARSGSTAPASGSTRCARPTRSERPVRPGRCVSAATSGPQVRVRGRAVDQHGLPVDLGGVGPVAARSSLNVRQVGASDPGRSTGSPSTASSST